MAHLAQTTPISTTNQSFTREGQNGRAGGRGNGRNGRAGGRFPSNRPQCQLCGRLGHTGLLTMSQLSMPTLCNIRIRAKSLSSSMLVTKAQLLRGKTRGGIYIFDNLVIPRASSMHSATSVPITKLSTTAVCKPCYYMH
ncbi:hypothetical protein PIB30_089878 [Stylosanthes scabra]|uniref:Uncharacterized protein n=1 Tax=Stylosanthes scabra TaxID=79078 RepID=A0ABU6SUX9_9FABA|nr:hypothetical protein [Stylosanthes scabra]